MLRPQPAFLTFAAGALSRLWPMTASGQSAPLRKIPEALLSLTEGRHDGRPILAQIQQLQRSLTAVLRMSCH